MYYPHFIFGLLWFNSTYLLLCWLFFHVGSIKESFTVVIQGTTVRFLVSCDFYYTSMRLLACSV